MIIRVNFDKREHQKIDVMSILLAIYYLNTS